MRMSLFPSPPIVCPRGTNISLTRERRGTNISHTQEEGWGQIFFTHGGRGQTFFVGAYDAVNEEMVVSEVNIFVSEASKLSAGARIFRGP